MKIDIDEVKYRDDIKRLLRDLERDNQKFRFTITENTFEPWAIKAFRKPLGLGSTRNPNLVIAEHVENFNPDVEGLKNAMRRLNDAGFKVFPNGFSATKPKPVEPDYSNLSPKGLVDMLGAANPGLAFTLYLHDRPGTDKKLLTVRHATDMTRGIDITFRDMGELFSELHRLASRGHFVLRAPEEEQKPTVCPVCGGLTAIIRGRHPGQPKRTVCPTCVVERLEDLCYNATLSPASSCDKSAKYYGVHPVLDKVTELHYDKWEGKPQPKAITGSTGNFTLNPVLHTENLAGAK